uniref:Uncharacterized protein n=1 Tax=Globodera rostochiensis TaxID=31243 RepID=A0A914HU75_GLORO
MFRIKNYQLNRNETDRLLIAFLCAADGKTTISDRTTTTNPGNVTITTPDTDGPVELEVPETDHSVLDPKKKPSSDRTAKLYEPKDNPQIKRSYTSNLVYWNDVTQTCHRKNKTEDRNENDQILTNEIIVIDSTKIGATAKKKMISDNDTLFNAWSYCAKVMFYGELGLDEAREHFEQAAPTEQFSNLRKFEDYGFMQDMVLLLIDGCIECKNAKEMDVQLSIVQDLKAGKIPEVCPAESRTYGKTTVTLENGTSYFVFGVVLRERLCPQYKVPEKVPNNINDIVIEKLKYKYEDLKLVVEYKCVQEKKTIISMMFPTIDVFETDEMDRVLQLRDLKLNLTTLNVGAKLVKGATKMKDSKSGIYYIVSVVPGPEPVTTMATGKTSKPTKMPSTKMPPTKMPPTKMPPTKMPPTEMPKPTVTDKNMTTMAPTDKTPKPPAQKPRKFVDSFGNFPPSGHIRKRGSNLLPILRILLQHLQLLTVKDEQVGHHFTCVSMMLPIFNLTGMDRVLQLRDLELNLTTLNVGATLNQSAVRMKDPTSGIYYIVSVVPGPEPVTTMATGKTSKPTKMPSTKMPPTKMPPTEMPPTEMPKPTVTDKNMTTMAPTDKTPKRTKMPKSP